MRQLLFFAVLLSLAPKNLLAGAYEYLHWHSDDFGIHAGYLDAPGDEYPPVLKLAWMTTGAGAFYSGFLYPSAVSASGGAHEFYLHNGYYPNFDEQMGPLFLSLAAARLLWGLGAPHAYPNAKVSWEANGRNEILPLGRSFSGADLDAAFNKAKALSGARVPIVLIRDTERDSFLIRRAEAETLFGATLDQFDYGNLKDFLLRLSERAALFEFTGHEPLLRILPGYRRVNDWFNLRPCPLPIMPRREDDIAWTRWLFINSDFARALVGEAYAKKALDLSPLIAEILVSEDFDLPVHIPVRRAAITSLLDNRIDVDRHLSGFIAAGLMDPDEEVRRRAILALSRVGSNEDPELIQVMIESAAKSSTRVRQAVIQGIRRRNFSFPEDRWLYALASDDVNSVRKEAESAIHFRRGARLRALDQRSTARGVHDAAGTSLMDSLGQLLPEKNTPDGYETVYEEARELIRVYIDAQLKTKKSEYNKAREPRAETEAIVDDLLRTIPLEEIKGLPVYSLMALLSDAGELSINRLLNEVVSQEFGQNFDVTLLTSKLDKTSARFQRFEYWATMSGAFVGLGIFAFKLFTDPAFARMMGIGSGLGPMAAFLLIPPMLAGAAAFYPFDLVRWRVLKKETLAELRYTLAVATNRDRHFATAPPRSLTGRCAEFMLNIARSLRRKPGVVVTPNDR